MVKTRLLVAVGLAILTLAQGQLADYTPATLLQAVANVSQVVRVNTSIELYEAMQLINETDVVVQLNGNLDLSDPFWNTSEPTVVGSGRILVLRSPPLSTLPDITSSIDALRDAGAVTLNFSQRPSVIVVEKGGVLAFSGLYATGNPAMDDPFRTTVVYGLAGYPSINVVGDAWLVQNYTAFTYFERDGECSQADLNNVAFRSGVALNNASATGIVDGADAVYLRGTGNFSFPILDTAQGNATVGSAHLLVDNFVIQCLSGPNAPAFLPTASDATSDDSQGDLPAWAWILIGLAIADIIAIALVSGFILKRRSRERQFHTVPGNAPRGDAEAPASPVSRVNTGLASTPSSVPWGSADIKEAEALDIDVAALVQFKDAWRSRIGKLHGLAFYEMVGRGGFGTVYRATWKGTVVAVKLIEHSVDSTMTRHIQREAALSTSVSHPHVVLTYKVCTVGLGDLQKMQHYVEVSSSPAVQQTQLARPESGLSVEMVTQTPSASTSSADMVVAGQGGGSSSATAAGPSYASSASAASTSAASLSMAAQQTGNLSIPEDLVATLIIMEFCDLGTVHSALHHAGAFHENGVGSTDGVGSSLKVDRISMMRALVDVAMGMDYLHNVTGIRHGDLKPANVLLKTAGNLRRGWVAKIGDFGVAKVLDTGRQSMSAVQLSSGTHNYLAPEQMNAVQQVSAATDCYAFGLMMWELWTAKVPFRDIGLAEMGYRVGTLGERPSPEPDMPETYKKLMESCWAPDPALRPSFEKVLVSLRGILAEEVSAAGADAVRSNKRFLQKIQGGFEGAVQGVQ